MNIRFATAEGSRQLFVEQYEDRMWYVCSWQVGKDNVELLSTGVQIKAQAEKELVKLCDTQNLKLLSGCKKVNRIRQALDFEKKARAAGVLALITFDHNRIVDMAFYQFDSIDVDPANKDEFQFVSYKGEDITSFFHVRRKDIIASKTDYVILTSGLLEAFIIKRRAPGLAIDPK